MNFRTSLAGLALTLGVAATASASPTSIYDFAVFAGGGITTGTGAPELHLGQTTTVNGFVGSNQDLQMLSQATVNATGVYVGGYLQMGQNAVIGSASQLAKVVVGGSNGVSGKEADINGTINGDLMVTGDVLLRSNANVTGSVEYTGALSTNGSPSYSATHVASTTAFSTVATPAASAMTAGVLDKSCTGASCTSLTLAPGQYRNIDIGSNKVLNLTAGDYYFNTFTSNSGLVLNLDVTNGPINIYVVGLANFGSNHTTKLKGAGTGGVYVEPSAAPALASLVYLETKNKFNINSGTKWAGTVYASQFESGADESYVGTGVSWYGAVYAYDSVEIRSNTVLNYIRSYRAPIETSNVPEPASLSLIGGGVALALGRSWKRRKGAANVA